MSTVNEVKVWDPLVRIFHWLLVASFTIAYLVVEDALAIHVAAGYTVLGLIVLRIVWGLIGPRYARFIDFVYAPRVAVQYVIDTLKFRARRYLGHNPAGGWMVVALIVALILTTVTGVVLYGVDEHAGPLSGMMAGAGEDVEDALEEAHEWVSNLTLALIFIHVAGVLFESRLHKENLVLAMITGRKRAEDNAVG